MRISSASGVGGAGGVGGADRTRSPTVLLSLEVHDCFGTFGLEPSAPEGELAFYQSEERCGVPESEKEWSGTWDFDPDGGSYYQVRVSGDFEQLHAPAEIPLVK